jgi:N-acetylneuraminic acid mutarotase
MNVWGGYGVFPNGDESFGDGALYDPIADTWTHMSPAPGSKSSYTNNSAVWTGTQVLVWGGIEASPGFSNDSAAAPAGLAYDPAKDSWTTLPTDGQPSLREGHVAVWDGTEMLVWGGYAEYPCGNDCTGSNYGYRYNPTTDQWQYITTVNAPGPRVVNGIVWTGQGLVIWGGLTGGGFDLRDGAVWTP